jgi:tetratricopeptide (TPR) repeat protein
MITYIRLLFLPLNLNLDYDYPVFKSFSEIPVFTSFLCLAAILYFAKRQFSKYRLLSFSICWFFLALLPESSIVPQDDVIFEHRLYLPLAGYCMFLAGGAYYICASVKRPNCFVWRKGRVIARSLKGDEAISKRTIKFIVLILSLVIAFNSVLTYQRNKIWQNDIVLWEDVIQKSPHKARPYINRGLAYYNQGNYIQAMSDYNKAIAIGPQFIYPYEYRGLIYIKEGEIPQAISEYDTAIKINPYYAEVYYHRGLAFLKQNNYSQALADYNKAIELNPEYVDAYNDRAKLDQAQGNSVQAISDHTKSIQIDPGQADIKCCDRYNLKIF